MSLVEARPQSYADEGMPLDVRSVTKTFRRHAHARDDGGGTGDSRVRSGSRWRRDRVQHTAVDNVSFRIGPGEIFGVIGANGSGKSTLIRMLSTLLVPDAGQVLVFGHDALREPLAVRPLLNRVSADPSFFRAMSPLENLLFYGRAYGLSGSLVRSRSRQILDRLGLEPRSHPRADAATCRAVSSRRWRSPAPFSRPPAAHAARRAHHRARPTMQARRAALRRRGPARRRCGDPAHHPRHGRGGPLCDRMAFLAGGRIVAEGTPASSSGPWPTADAGRGARESRTSTWKPSSWPSPAAHRRRRGRGRSDRIDVCTER